MKIEKFVTGIISTNCYLVSNEETRQAVIVDPAAVPRALKETVEREGLRIEAVLLTHGHFDHMMGLDALMKLCRCRSMWRRRPGDPDGSPVESVRHIYGRLYIFRSTECERRADPVFCRI